jgi:ankyrin repeat protein
MFFKNKGLALIGQFLILTNISAMEKIEPVSKEEELLRQFYPKSEKRKPQAARENRSTKSNTVDKGDEEIIAEIKRVLYAANFSDFEKYFELLTACKDKVVIVRKPLFDNGKSALHKAVQAGNMAAVKKLCLLGALVNSTDDRGVTPLDEAETWEHKEIYAFLKKMRGNEETQPSNKEVIPDFTEPEEKKSTSGSKKHTHEKKSKANQSDAIKELATIYNDFLASQTMISERELARRKELIKGCVSVEELAQLHEKIIDVNGNSALHFAAEQNALSKVQCLVRAGVDLNIKNAADLTALHVAFSRNNFDIIFYLCKEGANLNITNQEGETILLLAMKNNAAHVVRALLQAKADPAIADKEGRSPLMFAVFKNDLGLVTMLSEAGAHVPLGALEKLYKSRKWRRNNCAIEYDYHFSPEIYDYLKSLTTSNSETNTLVEIPLDFEKIVVRSDAECVSCLCCSVGKSCCKGCGSYWDKKCCKCCGNFWNRCCSTPVVAIIGVVIVVSVSFFLVLVIAVPLLVEQEQLQEYCLSECPSSCSYIRCINQECCQR